MVAGARLFEQTFGLSYDITALWAGAAATILYVFVGGFLAVSWTDTVQASLMIFALLLTPVIVMMHAGGFDEAVQAINSMDVKYSDLVPYNRHRYHFSDGVGTGLYGAAHVCPFHGYQLSRSHAECPPYWHDLDGSVLGRGCWLLLDCVILRPIRRR